MQLNLLKEPNENLSLVEMILTNRGIPLENVHKFLQTDDIKIIFEEEIEITENLMQQQEAEFSE